MSIKIILGCHLHSELENLKAQAQQLSVDTGAEVTAEVISTDAPRVTRDAGKVVHGDAPPESLGRHLETSEDVRKWLGHPSNWKKTQLFIIYWEGNVPKISETFVGELRRDSFCQVVVREQANRKRRPTNDEINLGELI